MILSMLGFSQIVSQHWVSSKWHRDSVGLTRLGVFKTNYVTLLPLHFPPPHLSLPRGCRREGEESLFMLLLLLCFRLLLPLVFSSILLLATPLGPAARGTGQPQQCHGSLLPHRPDLDHPAHHGGRDL
jgi:hypothetical protein